MNVEYTRRRKVCPVIVVSAPHFVQRKGILHAVVIQVVRGVEVVVEVLPAPEMSLYNFARLNAFSRCNVVGVVLAITMHYLGFEGGLAVAVRGAEVVAVGTCHWTFPDETVDVL